MSRILIVDDSRTTIEVVKVHLMNQGYEFVATFASATALDVAREKTPDLIISDLAMPGLTGIELCKRVRMVPGLQSERSSACCLRTSSPPPSACAQARS